jgi:starch phosphorylase
MAYDTPLPGFNTWNCNFVRLWKAKPDSDQEFDLKAFNDSQYQKAIVHRQSAEQITSVLDYCN